MKNILLKFNLIRFCHPKVVNARNVSLVSLQLFNSNTTTPVKLRFRIALICEIPIYLFAWNK